MEKHLVLLFVFPVSIFGCQWWINRFLTIRLRDWMWYPLGRNEIQLHLPWTGVDTHMNWTTFSGNRGSRWHRDAFIRRPERSWSSWGWKKCNYESDFTSYECIVPKQASMEFFHLLREDQLMLISQSVFVAFLCFLLYLSFSILCPAYYFTTIVRTWNTKPQVGMVVGLANSSWMLLGRGTFGYIHNMWETWIRWTMVSSGILCIEVRFYWHPCDLIIVCINKWWSYRIWSSQDYRQKKCYFKYELNILHSFFCVYILKRWSQRHVYSSES